MDWNKRNKFLIAGLRGCAISWTINIAIFSLFALFSHVLFTFLPWFALYFFANCVSYFVVAYFPNLFKWVKTLRGRFAVPEIGTGVIMLASLMVFLLGVVLSSILIHNIVISTIMIFFFAVFHYCIVIILSNKDDSDDHAFKGFSEKIQELVARVRAEHGPSAVPSPA